MQEGNSELSLCPSFNSYSSDKVADIAAKVTSEYFAEEDQRRHEQQQQQKIDGKDEDTDDDFEFVSVLKSEDVVFFDGRTGTGPVFPVFNRDLLKSPQQVDDIDDRRGGNPTAENDVRSMRVPLMKLFVEEEERDLLPSSSSSEADELDGVPTGTYCVWAPNNNNSVKNSPSLSKKSNSTGSLSKRWKLLNLLKRSNSEGKDAFVFLTPSNSKKEEIINKAEVSNKAEDSKEKKAKFKGETVSSAHQAFYAKNKTDKRRTYLPYRQDLVGFWTNMGALGRSFPPF